MARTPPRGRNPRLYEGAKSQMESGGFDIFWQWYTPYAVFSQARAWRRPKMTLEKLRFFAQASSPAYSG